MVKLSNIQGSTETPRAMQSQARAVKTVWAEVLGSRL